MFNEFINTILLSLNSDLTQLKNIWDNFPLGVVATNLNGEIIYYNNAHAKIDSLNQEEVLGKKEIDVLIPITGPNIMEVVQKIGNPILGYIFPYRTYKGKIINAAYWVFPVFKKEKIVASICFTQPLLSEMLSQGKAYQTPPIQWPGTVPINMPIKNIVGENKVFKDLINLTKSSANTPFPMLIAGETGSGKEIFAKLIHQASKRRNKPYIAINCSAIPENLLEGLLFGTTKGSFTGAIDRAGLFEEAQGGSFYLDEIDSMPLDLQPKLLRVLQEMRITRVGSAKEIDLDIKIISSIGSSSRDVLENKVLRPDLFYRLAVVSIDIPPLRKRLDDLELLADFFICKYNNLLKKSALKIDKNLLNLMNLYHWPGNIRELEHLIAGAINNATDENFIKYEHLTEHYRQTFSDIKNTSFKQNPSQIFELENNNLKQNEIKLNNQYEEILQIKPIKRLINEQQNIYQALTEYNGNVSKAAQSMGISRQLLSYRMQKYSLSHYDFKK